MRTMKRSERSKRGARKRSMSENAPKATTKGKRSEMPRTSERRSKQQKVPAVPIQMSGFFQ